MNATRQVPPSVPLAAWETGPSACPIGPHSFNHTLTPELSPYLTTFSGSTQRLLTITASRPYIQSAEDFSLGYLRASERPTICGRFQDTGSSSRTGQLPDPDRFVFDGHCLLLRPAIRLTTLSARPSSPVHCLSIVDCSHKCHRRVRRKFPVRPQRSNNRACLPPRLEVTPVPETRQ